jgi:glycosyltransferase involved in cell wall biosynthesis
MIRVLFVQGAGERAGAEGILLGLVRHLPTYGVEPAVAFLADGPFVDEVAEAGGRTITLPVSVRAREVWRIPGVSRMIASAARDVGADVLQANGEKMAIYSGRAARIAGVPSVFRLHDAPMRGPGSFVVQLAMVLSPHDAVVTGSAWMAEEFRRRWHLRARPIPNGVDLDRLPAAAADVSSITGWPAGSIVVGFFGRLQKWKGVEVFLRAAAEVARAHADVRFLVVGGALYGWEQPYGEGLPKLAEELGVAERVHFTGHRDDALALMAGCDIVVHASLRSEPLGMVVPEAMALRRAVVASRSRGPEEVIDHERTGILVAPGDEGALAEALRRLIADPDERARLGAAGEESVRLRWSATRMASEFADLYAGLCGRDRDLS